MNGTRRIGSVVLVGALALAGCGGDAPAVQGPSTETPGAKPAPSKKAPREKGADKEKR